VLSAPLALVRPSKNPSFALMCARNHPPTHFAKTDSLSSKSKSHQHPITPPSSTNHLLVGFLSQQWSFRSPYALPTAQLGLLWVVLVSKEVVVLCEG